MQEALKNKIEEKEVVEQVLKQIGELDEKLLKAEEALASEEELRHSENAELLAGEMKAAEELEHLLAATLEQLNASNVDELNEEQRRDVEKKRERTSWMLDRLRALCETLASLLSSLHAWDNEKGILKSVTTTFADEAQGLTESYANNPQPYTTACNDVRKANDLLGRIKEVQQQLVDANERLKATLPECNTAIGESNKIAAELEAARNIVEVSDALVVFAHRYLGALGKAEKYRRNASSASK